ncbi:hypothetical protein ACOQFO_05905 [Ureibacillus sp. MALMAid1270]|uniref:hypothetical protein n=1 Tax=Ureibacillus sp. MALMAid1270 TaxID=3411629 RepID=UPI003BA633BB
MNKRKLLSLGTIAILLIIALTYFFIKGQQSQTFAEANRVFPPYDQYIMDELHIYSEENNAMIPVEISSDDMKILTEIMNTTEVSGDNIKEPFSKTLIVEQKFRDIAGGNLNFTLYRFNNHFYVAIPVDIHTNEIEWYQLKSTDLPEFYLKLLEKTPQK